MHWYREQRAESVTAFHLFHKKCVKLLHLNINQFADMVKIVFNDKYTEAVQLTQQIRESASF